MTDTQTFDEPFATRLELMPTPQAAFDRLCTLYDEAIATIAKNFQSFAVDSTLPQDHPTYPYLCIDVAYGDELASTSLAFGRVTHQGRYGTTITAPALFRHYLLEQMTLLAHNYDIKIYVGHSRTPIPLTFAVERSAAQMRWHQRRKLAEHFPLPKLDTDYDDLVDGGLWKSDEPMPLSLFSAERIDLSLHRLRHYTGTAPEHFQDFVLFTNYQRYIDEFIAYARGEIEAGRAEAFVEPGGHITRKGDTPPPPLAKLPQMPAYHLVQNGSDGITLVNIGVGPSNAKTVTDHLAVLRPHVWLMVGHCGGLRDSQRLGDYVLAHAYLRDDQVLDEMLPVEIPVPPIAEVQLALAQAVNEIDGANGHLLKERLRTGTVVTTADRNWELRFAHQARRFNQSRAIAIDMESATIAANGYRFRVPYGTLLCVSDRPLHGEIKLPGMADAFYEERVAQHLRIGIRALELLREGAHAGSLHSRKLRSFTEPAFR
ncbi:MAG: AMP nucleosidase [Rhizomicrobium sp.]